MSRLAKSRNKDYTALARVAREAGWRVERTNGGHMRWMPPVGTPIYSSSSPSDWRAIAKHRSLLRRAGLDC